MIGQLCAVLGLQKRESLEGSELCFYSKHLVFRKNHPSVFFPFKDFTKYLADPGEARGCFTNTSVTHYLIDSFTNSLVKISLWRRHNQTVQNGAPVVKQTTFWILKGIKIAVLVQNLRRFCWTDWFCLLVDLHREGSAPAACAAGLFRTISIYKLEPKKCKYFSLQVAMSLSLVCAIAKPCFPVDWRLLVKELIANIGIPLDLFGFWLFQWFVCSFNIFFLVLRSLQTSLLCIIGKLAGEGLRLWLLALVTSNTWHLTPNTWCLTDEFVAFCFCLFWYLCYYPHKLRDSESPIWEIFFMGSN